MHINWKLNSEVTVVKDINYNKTARTLL